MKRLFACYLVFLTAAISAHATPSATLTHRYSFTSNANDSVGTAHGSLMGGATISSSAVSLNGSSAYVQLPASLVSTYDSVSFEAWFVDYGSSSWARLWDFGNSQNGAGAQGGGVSYMFMAVPNSDGGYRGAYQETGLGEQLIDSSPRPTMGVQHHLVWTQDSATQTACVYLDGQQTGTHTSFTYTPAAIGVTVNDWLGRSQYDDPYFWGTITEFRIYQGALSSNEVVMDYQFGADKAPQVMPVTITAQPQSVTVNEGVNASFTINYYGQQPIQFQWLRNGQPITGATNDTLTLNAAKPVDNGALYSVLLTNTSSGIQYSAASSAATLTVVSDTTSPTLVRAYNLGQTTVNVEFSEPVDPISSVNANNYSLDGGITISKAALDEDNITVSLTVSPLTLGSNYTLVVNNVSDQAATPNIIPTNSTTQFVATSFMMQDINNSFPTSMLSASSNSVTVTSGGGDIGGTADQFGFAYNQRTGNFDIQARIENISAIDLWSKAGLMARATLDANSACATVIATPGLQGAWFAYRTAAGSLLVPSSSLPPSYPNMWIRLKRAGNTLSGYASYDGNAWIALGSITMSLPNTLYVGMAVASHANGQACAVRFSNVGETASTATTTRPTTEVLGPSSRRTPLVISEIMYKPAKRTDGKNLEFIEIFNSNPYRQDMSGYRLSGDIDFTFPTNTFLPGSGFLVVAAAPSDISSVYGIQNVYGPYTNSLKANATIRLQDEVGARLLSVSYSADPPWPLAADGAGHSLVLSCPSYGENNPNAWSASDAVGGSPGNFEGIVTDQARNVVINEIMFTEASNGIIELYNHGNQAVDLSGCILTDDANVNRYIIPTNTTIPARGYHTFYSQQCGLKLTAEGGDLFLKNATQTRIIDALRFAAQEPGVAYGRSPNGSSQWYRLASFTPGASNAAPLVDDIGINEIMYHPLCGSNDAQYVELYNHGTNKVDLSGWKFVSGISYTFPTGTVLDAGSYLVVARNKSWMLGNYTNLNTTNTVGDFSGTLAQSGERLALAKPYSLVSTSSKGLPTTNFLEIIVDEVTYVDGGKWGDWSDGGGSSLELIDPRSNKRLPSNWADSDETAKAPWTTIETTGVLDNGANYENTIAHGQVGLLDGGECLIDDVEVRLGTTGANWVANPGFDQGTTYWSLQGSFSRSAVDSGAGYPQSGNALHLRTTERLWTGANSAQFTLSTTTLASGQTATLRFKARWLKGWPEVMMRLNGNWLEAAGRMTVPANLGTPGLPNSRAVTNAVPAIYGVVHSPTIPAAAQAVVVTASVSDPDGIQALQLCYRLDSASAYTTVNMVDDGTGGDSIAGDGIYSATIPGQSTGTLVAFYVSAMDSQGATSRFPALKNENAPVHECLVVFGDNNKPSPFGAYHLWVSKANITRWNSLPILSNEDVDGTLVCGNRVIYNIGTHYAGSPYHQAFTTPTGNPCHYNWTMPKDDKFLGSSSFNKIHWIGNDIQNDTPTQNINDSTLQREQVANTFLRGLGAPWIYRRYVAVYVNGTRRGYLMEDALRPSVSVPDEYFPDDTDGVLMKIQPWFEFGPSPSGTYMPWANQSWAYLSPYKTTSDAFKTARYRWSYEVRETPDSMMHYTNLYALINAANSSGANYATTLQSQVNMENLMRLLAAMHAAGNWDCIGIQNGQNAYAYSSPKVPWTFFMFDASIVLGNSISWSPGANLFTTTSDGFGTMLNEPTFMRMYLRALKELTTGPMAAANVAAFVDGRYAAFRAEGLSPTSPSVIKTWVSQAAASITTQVISRDTTSFTVTATNVTATSNAVTLTGYAPVLANTILINGITYPIKWITATRWSITIPATQGTNSLNVAAYDRFGNAVGTTNAVTVINTAQAESPVGNVVIHEILFNPWLEGAQYVELYNRATNTPFDLSGWELNGLSYTFPKGSTIKPGNYLLLAKSAIEFAAVTGGLTPVFDQFDGNLQTDGETLTLLSSNTVIDRVRYETNTPWPTCPIGTSLQLVDSSQDNSRSGNWATGRANAIVSPAQWVYYSAVGTATSSSLYMYLESAGDIYIDDIKLVSGSVPNSGSNLLSNGDFESTFPGSWNVSANLSGSSLSSTVKHGGNYSLHLVSTSAGSSRSTSIYQDISPSLTIGQAYSISFWYLQTTNGGPLTLRLSSSGINVNLDPSPVTQPALAVATPGYANSVSSNMAAFPPIWLNELVANNTSGISNEFGERATWFEIYNPSTNTVNLAGLCVSTNYSKPSLWSFPSGASIAPGEHMIVWADFRNGRTGSNTWHTNFKLASTQGSLLLSRTNGTSMQIVDYLNYSGLAAGQSYGDLPDGQPFYRGAMFYPTPGASNSDALPPITVYINEWMAENSKEGGISDPADGHYDDWFELYNAGTNTANLAGYYLSDDPLDKQKFKIPSGYTIAPKGFLLVWADNETTENSTNLSDLHVNFKLSKSGEQIGLFAADGSQIDMVIFGAQTANVSEGHYPDGTGPISPMTIPTPRAPNTAPSTPPVLSVIDDQNTYQEQVLQLTVPLVSAQTPVTFSLGSDSPVGATINPSTGVFIWKPSINTAVGTYPITVLAKDTLGQTDSKIFNVSVAAFPDISRGVVLNQGSLTFTFQTLPHQTYEMQFTDVIEPATWQPLAEAVVGDGSTAVIHADVNTTAQRFFRLVVKRQQ